MTIRSGFAGLLAWARLHPLLALLYTSIFVILLSAVGIFYGLARQNFRPQWVCSMDWSPDGTRLAVVYRDRSVGVITFGAGGSSSMELLREPNANTDLLPLECVAWSPDSKTLGCVFEKLELWDVSRKVLIATHEFHDVNFNEGLAWCPDATQVATVYPYDIRILNLPGLGQRGKIIYPDVSGIGEQDPNSDANPTIPGSPRELRWSPDGSKLALLGGEATWVCDAKTGSNIIQIPQGGMKVFCWSPDGRQAAAGGPSLGPGPDDAHVQLYDTAPFAKSRALKMRNFKGDAPLIHLNLRWSSDGRRIAAASIMADSDQGGAAPHPQERRPSFVLTWWDVATGQPLAQLKPQITGVRSTRIMSEAEMPNGWDFLTGGLVCAACSPQADKVAIASNHLLYAKGFRQETGCFSLIQIVKAPAIVLNSVAATGSSK